MTYRYLGYVFIVCLAGCATQPLTPYKSSQPGNVTIALGEFSDRDIQYRIDVYSVDEHCEGIYQGTVNINGKPAKIGIPFEEPTLLAFYFTRLSWLRGDTGVLNVDAFLTAKTGFQYEVVLNYVDNTYDVNLYRINLQTAEKSEMRVVDLSACQPLKI